MNVDDRAVSGPRYQQAIDAGRWRCLVCPHACVLADGQRGRCRVRQATGQGIRCVVDGRPSAVAIDPVEKKPFSHLHPGRDILSVGTAGCNLSCRFCQNVHLSRAGDPPPEREFGGDAGSLADLAVERGCVGVAMTYNDPTVCVEYAVAVATACRDRGLISAVVSAGYIHGTARSDLYGAVDAANIDLKAWNPAVYRHYCGVERDAVLDTLVHIARHTQVWLEVTTLVIPGLNDDPADLEAMAGWIVRHLGPDVPWHLSAYHPTPDFAEAPPTPVQTLVEAQAIAIQAGLRHVYTTATDAVTRCRSCGAELIKRRGFRVVSNRLVDARCPACAGPVPGIFATGTAGASS